MEGTFSLFQSVKLKFHAGRKRIVIRGFPWHCPRQIELVCFMSKSFMSSLDFRLIGAEALKFMIRISRKLRSKNYTEIWNFLTFFQQKELSVSRGCYDTYTIGALPSSREKKCFSFERAFNCRRISCASSGLPWRDEQVRSVITSRQVSVTKRSQGSRHPWKLVASTDANVCLKEFTIAEPIFRRNVPRNSD